MACRNLPFQDGVTPCKNRVMTPTFLFTPTFMYTTMQSLVGHLTLVASARGLVQVAFDHEKAMERFHGDLEQDGDIDIDDAEDIAPELRHLSAAKMQLEEYFNGNRTFFALNLDLLGPFPSAGSEESREPSVFRTHAQLALQQIPYGHVGTYGQIATLIGSPLAARAVGTACATNPLPIVLPCHRIVRADGSLGHYTGGTWIKETLLELEKASANRSQPKPSGPPLWS